MGKTYRRNRKHLHVSRDDYVRHQALRDWLRLNQNGFERVRLTSDEIESINAFIWSQFLDEMDAWDEAGREDPKPEVPWGTEKSRIVDFDYRPFAVYMAEKADVFAREYDKDHRDGKVFNHEHYTALCVKRKRRKARVTMRRITQNPTLWDDGECKGVGKDQAIYFFDPYY